MPVKDEEEEIQLFTHWTNIYVQCEILERLETAKNVKALVPGHWG